MDDTSRRVNRSDEITGRRDEEIRGRTGESMRDYAAPNRTEAAFDAQATRRSSEIRDDIEHTREEMSETIDAIQEKLRPANIVASATESVKRAASEKVRQLADTAGQAAGDVVTQTRDAAGEVVSGIRDNSVPVAMIGIGAAWLLMNRQKAAQSPRWNGPSGQRTYPRSQAFDAAYLEPAYDEYGVNYRSGEAGTLDRLGSNRALGDTAGRVRQTGLRPQSQLRRMIQENPLLLGAGALLLGAAFGLGLPETEREREWMGETRDNMLERAQDMARHAASTVTEAANTMVSDVAGKVGIDPKST